jgi:hypothetical protein
MTPHPPRPAPAKAPRPLPLRVLARARWGVGAGGRRGGTMGLAAGKRRQENRPRGTRSPTARGSSPRASRAGATGRALGGRSGSNGELTGEELRLEIPKKPFHHPHLDGEQPIGLWVGMESDASAARYKKNASWHGNEPDGPAPRPARSFFGPQHDPAVIGTAVCGRKLPLKLVQTIETCVCTSGNPCVPGRVRARRPALLARRSKREPRLDRACAAGPGPGPLQTRARRRRAAAPRRLRALTAPARGRAARQGPRRRPLPRLLPLSASAPPYNINKTIIMIKASIKITVAPAEALPRIRVRVPDL